ncbi:MAG: 30S ribosomal protein S20, partial [Spirochaetales bacterium]|nr:30S ribosomal protein S20 [Spirochaetales bacterium]
MPLNKSALKRERQDVVRRARNRIIKSKVHTAYRNLCES